MNNMDIFGLIILLLGVCINLLLAAFVYFRNPKSETNRLFVLLGFITSIWLLIYYISSLTLPPHLSIVLIRLSIFFATFMSGIFYLFSYTLPNTAISIGKKMQYLFLLLTLVIMTITISPYTFTKVTIINGTPSPQVGIGIAAFLLYVIITNALAVIHLFKKYLTSSGYEKEQVRFVMVGILAMHGLLIGTISLPIALFNNSLFVPLAPLYALIFLLSTSYAIVKHRLMDIRLIVVRAVTYVLLIFFSGLAYAIVLILIGSVISQSKLTMQQTLFSVVVTLFIAFTFQPVRRIIEKITNNIFFKDRYDTNTLLWNLSRTMASTLDLKQLIKMIVDQILDSMKINYGHIVLIRDKSIIWTESSGNTKNRSFKGNDIYNLIQKSYNSNNKNDQILLYEELHESEIKEVMRNSGVTVVLPLVVRKELIGGFFLGEKSSGEVYSSEDIELFKIVAPEIAVAVKNALSFEEIRRFNITLENEVEKATVRLRHANHRLKELDVLKDEFVSIASHELRTPMTAIKSYLWMAINKSPQKLDPQLRKYLDISYQSTERLIHLVNDMLTVSRIERDKIEIKRESFDISETLQLVYEELKITAQEKNIAFTLIKDKDKKYMVLGDKEKLREVFQNLVGNALKFTPNQGKITISCNMDKNGVHISVSDTGSGIPKGDQPKLFKKFSKIDYSYTKHSSQPGTGLGLYISKQIVSLHHGDITVQSEVEKGSTFTVNLPLLNSKGGESKKND